MKTIHYFTGKQEGKKVAFVIISPDFRPVGDKINVSGKAEARKIAKTRKLKPWNF